MVRNSHKICFSAHNMHNVRIIRPVANFWEFSFYQNWIPCHILTFLWKLPRDRNHSQIQLGQLRFTSLCQKNNQKNHQENHQENHANINQFAKLIFAKVTQRLKWFLDKVYCGKKMQVLISFPCTILRRLQRKMTQR